MAKLDFEVGQELIHKDTLERHRIVRIDIFSEYLGDIDIIVENINTNIRTREDVDHIAMSYDLV